MRKSSLGLVVVAAALMLSTTLLVAQQQQPGAGAAGAGAAGGAAAAQDLDKLWVEGSAMCILYEQKLAEAAQTQASDQQVKQFAQKVAQDHAQANQKIQELAQKIGVTAPQQLPEFMQRQIDAIKSQQGKDFDQAYLSCAKANHLAAVSSVADRARIAKNQDVKQFAQEQLPKLQQHQQEAVALASAQGLPTPIIGEAQTAGSRIPGEGQQPRSGQGPDAGQRGTQGQGQDTSGQQREQSR